MWPRSCFGSLGFRAGSKNIYDAHFPIHRGSAVNMIDMHLHHEVASFYERKSPKVHCKMSAAERQLIQVNMGYDYDPFLSYRNTYQVSWPIYLFFGV